MDFKLKYLKYKEKYLKYKKMLYGGTIYEDNKIIDTLKEKVKHPITLKKIDDFKTVDTSGIFSDIKPIATYGIATCMGFGVNINGTNYFSHLFPHEYSGLFPGMIDEWRIILSENKNDISDIFIYLPYGIPIDAFPFFKMINDLDLIDTVRHINTSVMNTLTLSYTDPFNNCFKVGISKDGAWAFDYSVIP
jgi:hypothetical protein